MCIVIFHSYLQYLSLTKIIVSCNKLMQMWDGTFWFCHKWSSIFSFGLSLSCFPRSKFFNFYWNDSACCTISRGVHIFCCRQRVDRSIQTRKQPNTWSARIGIVLWDGIICFGFLNGLEFSFLSNTLRRWRYTTAALMYTKKQPGRYSPELVKLLRRQLTAECDDRYPKVYLLR